MTAYFSLAASLATAANLLAQIPTPAHLPLKAEIVLTKETCGFKRWSRDPKDTYRVGGPTCRQLFSALSPLFVELTAVAQPSPIGSAQLTLIPKFVDVAPQSSRLTIIIEWTVLDQRGRAVWVASVEGNATADRDLRVWKWYPNWINAVAEDVAKKSAVKITTAPEIVKLQ